MRKVIGVFVVLAAVLIAGACDQKSPTEPTPTVPLCQTNGTALVAARNQSASGLTYAILWDGIAMDQIKPGTQTTQWTTTAGVAHKLEFKIAGTQTYACNVAYPVPTACSTPVYTCSK